MHYILNEIKEERTRQNEKWGEQNHKPIEWVAILTEEVGEVSKEALDHHFVNISEELNIEGRQIIIDELQHRRLNNYRKELIQVAAVAVQMIESLDRNELK